MPDLTAGQKSEYPSKHEHWWDALPGIFTALAALLTAINTLYHVIADSHLEDDSYHSSDDCENALDHSNISLKQSSINVRHGWREASKKLAASTDDAPIISELNTKGDKA